MLSKMRNILHRLNMLCYDEPMDKLQALHSFWSSFGWTAYNSASVPDNPKLPYITHELPVGNFGTTIAQTATLWVRSSAWTDLIDKLEEIMEEITRGGTHYHYDFGSIFIRLNSGNEISDPNDDTVRGYVLNYELEFLD